MHRNFGRSNLNLTIDLNCITVNNLAAKPQSHLNPKLAFAGSCRSDDGYDWLLQFVRRVHERKRKRRTSITSQMIASSTSAPRICAREKRMMSFTEEAKRVSFLFSHGFEPCENKRECLFPFTNFNTTSSNQSRCNKPSKFYRRSIPDAPIHKLHTGTNQRHVPSPCL